MSELYNVECTAIPDGIHVDGGKRLARVSVILRPEPRDDDFPAGVVPVTLLEWSDAIRQLDFVVSFGKDVGSLKAVVGTSPEFDPPEYSGDTSKIADANKKASEWWQKIWADPGLRTAFRQLMTRSARTAAEVESYSYALLSEIAYERIISDIWISTWAADKTVDPKKLTAKAKARRVDPNDPTIRISDALALLQRDAFAGLEIGDVYSNAMSSEDRQEYARSVDAALHKVFTDIRTAIDGEIEARLDFYSPKSNEKKVPWNPFLTDRKDRKDFDHEGILQNRYSDPIFGKAAEKGVRFDSSSLPFSSPSRLGLEAYRRLMRQSAKSSKVVGNDPAEDNRRQASRHIANLQAHPSVRKFVRLIVDIPVPVSAIPPDLLKDKKGVVSVRARSRAQINGTDWFYSDHIIATAFEIDDAGLFFEPCPEWQYFAGDPKRKPSQSLVPSLPLDKGVVQLNIGKEGQSDDGSRRFRLEVIDALAATSSHERAVVSMVSAIRKGFTVTEAVTDEPGSRTRGIMLLDTEAFVPAHVAEKRKAEASNLPAKPKDPSLLFAEDLIDGYRVDIVAPKPIDLGGGVSRQAFPAGSRTLSYDVIREAFGITDKNINPYGKYASRDEGFIRSPSSVVAAQKVDSGGKHVEVKRPVSSEVMFTWTGANLGLPTPVPKEFEDDRQPLLASELQMTVYYNFATDLGPIARLDDPYFIGLRGRKLNGGDVGTAMTERLVEHALGDETGQPFIFKNVERTPAPVVLVPADQTLAEPDKDADQPSELSVVAVKGMPNGPSVRMLVLPDVGFNMAEQQAQFDYPSKTPGVPADRVARERASKRAARGAYVRLKRNDKGGFPKFPGQGEQAQTLLFEIVDPPKENPAKPHFVDRTLWTLGNRLKPTGYSTDFDVSETTAEGLAFWKRPAGNDFAPEDVVPIRLEVVALEGSQKTRLVKGADKKIGPAGNPITVPVLRVEVGRADTLELSVWTDKIEPAELSHPALKFFPGLKRTVRSGADRIASLHEVTRFRILHPVQLPLAIPEILSLGATRCSAVDWEHGHGLLRDHQPSADSTFAWGKVRADRKSTASIWGDCRWIELDPARYIRRTSESGSRRLIEQDKVLYEHKGHVESGRLFTLADLPALQPSPGEEEEDFRERLDTIDLALDDQGNLRPLAADFRSTRARKIVTRLVARSRFAPSANSPNDYSNSIVSTPNDLFDQYVAQGLTGSQGPTPDGTAEFWLPATQAPAVPGLTRNHGIAYRRRFDDLTDLPSGERGTTLTHVYRCWLDNRWYDSGPFEKLAIICRAKATTPPDWLLPLLSKWGGDMTMRSGRPLGRPGDLASFLEPEQFVLEERQDVGFGKEFVPSILRNVPLPSLTGAERHNVDVALLGPKFHTGSGLWYCDIELKGASAFRVDLDLSLARYQHHAIEGCHISKPVSAGGFMLHQPWTFKAARSGQDIEIIVVGPAYVERAPMTLGLKTGLPENVVQRAGSPLLTVELERVVDGSPLPVRGLDGKAVVTTSAEARVDSSGPGIPEGCTRWKMALRIPPDPVYGDTLAVRVSLGSAHANSEAAEGDGRDGGLVTLPEPMVAQLFIGD
ncbi:hypothetical protein G6L94_21920 [Agrobacterium rhizogenes]|nr:hypothetical protein [Rhizobium rhizogenes]NTI96356.1 hypothetical protein [Rhizobium rhizogenes]NTJ61082.1 hypothetical protein [Rhizobium rhizogenes]OCJ23843.1 hypothetical protein A6U89_31780 [Agrobacterium sp. B133/95]